MCAMPHDDWPARGEGRKRGDWKEEGRKGFCAAVVEERRGRVHSGRKRERLGVEFPL